MKHSDKRKLGIIATLSTIAVFGLTATLVLADGNLSPFNVAGEDSSDYYVTLDSSNKWTSGTEKEVTTSSGAWSITFEYSGASAYTGGHVTLTEGGTLTNKTLIKSVDYIQVDWNGSGHLKAKTSFNGSTWGSLWDVADDFSYHLPSNPYFISFVAEDGSVNISSIRYQYSCIDNPEAEGQVTSTEFQLVKSTSEISAGDIVYLVGEQYYSNKWYGPSVLDTSIPTSSRPWYPGGTDVTVSSETIASGYTEWTVSKSGDNFIFTSGGDDLYAYTNGTNYSINIGTTYTISGTTTNVVTTYGATNTWNWVITNSTTGNGYLKSTSTDVYLTATPSYNPTTWRGSTGAKWGSESTYPFYIYKKTNVREWDTPKDLIGFTASDSKANTYKVSDVYATDNGLSATAHYSDGTSATIAKADLTYKVSIDAAGQNVIDKTAAFPSSGVYYVTVNYGNMMPSVIQLNVEASVSSISASMTNYQYNTADTVVFANNLTATITYSDSSTVTKTYAQFADAGLTVKLLTPAGVEYDPTLAFGTSGLWHARVSYSTSIYYDVTILVSAIPVQSISFNEGTTSTLYVGGTMQLNVVWNPATATNKNVNWTSSDSTVASVVDGLITAKKVGTATITAKAASDTSKKAEMVVTVKKQTATTATLIPDNNGTKSGTRIGSNDEGFVATGITVSNFSSSDVFGDDSETNVFKFGSSSAAGSIEIEFPATVITGVKITAASYGSDPDVAVKVSTSANTDGETISLTSTSSTEYVTTAFASDSAESTTFTIEQTKANKGRFYLYGIELTLGAVEPVYPTAISLPGTKNIALGEAYDLNNDLTFTPSDTNQKTVTWSSSNTSVATVSNGIVTSVAAGNTTITATAKDENDQDLTASCVVTVNTVLVTSVSLNKTTATMGVGEHLTLTATVSPSNASNQNISWTSSNTSAATVSDGVVTAVAITNSVTITARSTDGSNKSATCVIQITAAAPGYVHVDSSDLTATAIDYNKIYAPTEGDIKVLIVPLSLNGSTKGTWNTTTLNNMNTYFFGNGATSFKNYYNSVSHGKARFTGLVANPYTVTEYTTTELNNDDSMEKIFTLMENAVSKIMNDNSSFDWSQYDKNNDGWFDNIHFLTNYNATDWGANLWPHQYSTGHSGGTHSRPKVNNYSISSLYVQNELMSDSLTQIHEQGHIFGMDDYYSYTDNDYSDYIGSADMQDCNMFEWNSFSKLSAGWASPYVVDGTSSDFTLTMNSAATSEDCLIIPANYSTWNGCAFDEYFVVELFTNSGLNSSFWNAYTSGYREYGASLPSSGYGVRIYHVDARICEANGTTQVNPSSWRSTKSYIQGCNNSKNSSDYGSYNPNWSAFALLDLVQATGINTHSNGDYMCKEDLFKNGDVFNWSLANKFLRKDGSAVSTMDDGETFPWTITFTAMSMTSVSMRITRN